MRAPKTGSAMISYGAAGCYLVDAVIVV